MNTNNNWNIQGIFIPKIFSIEEIKTTFKFRNFSLQTKIGVQRAFSEYFEKRNFAVVHCKNGTIILHDDIATNEKLLATLSKEKETQILSCYVNSMTETYCFDLFEKGQSKRSSWSSVGQPAITQDKGEILDWENKNKKIDIIFNGIKNILQEDIIQADYDVEWYLQKK